MKAQKRPTPLRILTFKDKIANEHNGNRKITNVVERVSNFGRKKMQDNAKQKSLFVTFGLNKNEDEIYRKVIKNQQNEIRSNSKNNQFEPKNQSVDGQKQFEIRMIEVENKPNKTMNDYEKLIKSTHVVQKSTNTIKKQLSSQIIKTNKINQQILNTLPIKKIGQEDQIDLSQKIIKNDEKINKQNRRASQYSTNKKKNIPNPEITTQQNSPLSNPSSSQHSYSKLPIYSDAKYRNIPIIQKQASFEFSSNHNSHDDSLNLIKQTPRKQYQLTESPSENNSKIVSSSIVNITTGQSLNNQKNIKNNEQNSEQSHLLISIDNTTEKDPSITNKQKSIKQSKQIKITLNNNISSDNFEIEPSTNDILLNLVAHLGSNKSDRQMEKLRNKMKNQKNLRLKDYLRLTSLSNDIRFDKYNKSLPNIPKHYQKPKQISHDDTHTKIAINPQRSITLIKESLHKKLQQAMQTSLKLFEQIQEGSQLVGDQYEDLVFMCNFHRVFNENMFQTSELLEDLFQEYQTKQEINKMIDKKQAVTHEQVIQLLSPRRKKKKDEDSAILKNKSLISKILNGFNAMKMDDGQSNNNSTSSQVLGQID